MGLKRKLISSALIVLSLTGTANAFVDTGNNVIYTPAANNVGIGTSSPTTKLDINGQIMIRGGSPGAGKALQSDKNGKASWVDMSSVSNSSTLDGLDSSQLLRSDTTDNFTSGVFITDSGTRFDVNGDLSIADTNISLDGASTTLTQTSGAITLYPANGFNMNVRLDGVSDFVVDTNKLVLNNNGNVGLSFLNPTSRLSVNGTTFSKAFSINGNTLSVPSLTQGDILFSTVAGTLNRLGKGTNHYVLKTNGNTLKWELDAGSAGAPPNIDGLTDAKADISNLFLGNGAGTFSGGSNDYLTAVGIKALQYNSGGDGQYNTAVGYLTLNGNVSGDHNTAVGFTALTQSTGVSNTAVGSQSLLSNSSGSYNSAYGTDSLASNTSASKNTAMGYGSAYTNTTGNGITAIGYNALRSSSTASNSTAIGYQAAYSSIVGNGVALGTNALYSNTTGKFNTALGHSSLSSLTTGTRNTAVGYFAGEGNGSNSFSNGTFLGFNTGVSLTTGYSNTMIGSSAGLNVTNGNGNILLGYQAGDAITTGARNIVIGYDVDAPSNTTRGQLDIGNLIFGTSIDGTGTTVSTGNIGIASSAPNEKLTVNGRLALKETTAPSGTLNFGKIYTNASNHKLYYVNNGGIAYNLQNGASAVVAGSNTHFQFNDSGALGGNGALTFTKASKTLAVSADAPLDINSTSVSIADTDISLDGASTTFTQSSGAITLAPAAGSNVNLTLSGTGDFAVATNKLYVDTSASMVGINDSTPSTALDVTGTINSTAQVNGVTANFTTGNITNIAATKMIASGTVNGANANFTNVAVSGIFNGTTSSFDGDFTNGSILFSNAGGVLTQANSQLYFDRVNNRLAVGIGSASEKATINGNLALKEGSAPSGTLNFGKIYTNSTNHKLYYVNNGGVAYNLQNGAAASVAGSNTYFQFNDGGALGGNGALTFTKGSKTLAVSADAPLDINSTSVSIADTNIAFDGASTTFTSTGAMSLVSGGAISATPANGSNLNVTLDGVSDFIVDTNKLVLNNNGNVGLSYLNPTSRLSVNGGTFTKSFAINGSTLSLSQGAVLYSQIAGSASTLAKGTNHYVLKVNGNTLRWETDAGSSSSSLNIDALSDAKSDVYSVYLGNGAGLNHSGTAYNTAVGISALRRNNTGSTYNTAVGYQAMNGNTTGSNNTSLGYKSLYTNITGTSNTAIGSGTLQSNKTTSNSTAVGYNALNTNNGNENTALGSQTLNNNTEGYGNTAVGHQAIKNNVSGIYNTAVGYGSLYTAKARNFNTAMGTYAMNTNNGDNNVAFGAYTLFANTTGTGNTSIGTKTLYNPVTGSGNTALGYYAGYGTNANSYSNGTSLGYQTGYSITTGSNNTLIGYNSGYAVTNGNGNILLGYQAGDNITTGAKNIVIGHNIDAPSATTFGQLDIGNLIFGTSIDGTGTTISSGNIGIGIAAPNTKLTVNGNLALKETSAPSATSNYGKLYTNSANSKLYFQDDAGVSYNLVNGSGAVALNIDGLSDGKSDAYSVYLGNGAGLNHSGTAYNTAVGISALRSNNNANTNATAIGYQALYSNTSGQDNVGIGYQGLYSNTTGGSNTAVGRGALYTNTTKSGNTAMGYNALNTSNGDGNTAIGYQALRNNAAADNNTAIGYSALYNNITGIYNTATGYGALNGGKARNFSTAMGGYALNNNNGDNNSAFGHFALGSNTTGAQNTALGKGALYYPVTGSRNTGVGYYAGGGTNSNSFSNGTFLGYQTGLALTTGYNNTMLGYGAGVAVTNGNGNILLGYQAGDAITTGAKNIIIGHNIDAPSATTFGQLDIGNLIFGTGIDGTSTTISSGNIGIGIAAPNTKLTVNGNLALKETSAPSATSNYGKLYTNSANSKLYFQDDAGVSYNLVNGSGAVSLNIDGLSDGKANATDYFIGNGSGATWTTSATYNTALGTKSLNAVNATTGTYNTTVGYNGLVLVSTGDYNVSMGYNSGRSVTTTSNITAIGSFSLQANTASNSTALGYNSMYTNTSGASNTGLGHSALYSNSTGTRNTAVGYYAAYGSSNMDNGTFLGYNAGRTISTGDDNTFIGYLSSNGTTSGSYNTTVGSNSLYYPTTGARNTAIGYLAGEGTSGSSFSNGTFLGFQTGLALTTGYNNTMLGYGAGVAVTNGNGNILVGYQSGDNITTGARNIIIGHNIDAPSATGRGQLSIGNLIYGNGLTATTGTTVSGGKVAINKANPAYTMDVNGTTATKVLNINGNTMSVPSLTQGDLLFAKVAGTVNKLAKGTNHYTLKVNGNALAWEQAGSTVAGSTKQVQFNNGGTQSASANLTFNGGILKINNTALFGSEYNAGNSSTAATVNWNLGNRQYITMTGNCTLTLTAPQGTGNFLLRIIQDGTGGRTMTWPASVKWPSGIAPTLSTTAGAIDIVSCYYNGTNYYCTGSLDFQ